MNMNGSAYQSQGVDIAHSIVRELRSPEFIPIVYPELFRRGITGGSFHSYMVSALLLLGNRLGYSPICDSPVFDPLDKLLTGDGSKRPDSVWFERGTTIARVLIEFEHFTSTSLEHKARNLILMTNAHKYDIKLLTLMYWATEVRSVSELKSAVEIFKNGFSQNGYKYYPPACPVLILETKTIGKEEYLIIDGFIVRQLIIDKENKPYRVNELNQK